MNNATTEKENELNHMSESNDTNEETGCLKCEHYQLPKEIDVWSTKI